MGELGRNLRADQRPILDKSVSYFMAMTDEDKRGFVGRINSIYKHKVMSFHPERTKPQETDT